MNEKMPSYGGQAVIEGVLMRGKSNVSMAVRTPDGNIEVINDELTGLYRSGLTKIPFLRGLIILWDALGLGMKYLTLSANYQTGEDEKIEGPALYFTVGLSLLIGIALFFLAPAALAAWIENLTNIATGWINLIEGLIRLLILIVYLVLIGQLPDIKRTFAYHGAEHKTINAFEADMELIPEKVAIASREHPRCGTSFILTLVVISVLIFSLLPPLALHWRLISRLLLIPIVAGISYEYIRLISKYIENPIIKFISRPNLALQKLTTREPSLEMLEVAISAFQNMYTREKQL